MSGYVNVPIEVDPDAIAQVVFDYLETSLPGYTPSPGNLDVILTEAFAAIAAENREVASDVPRSILRYVGANLHGILPTAEAPATATATFTVRDTAGYTIPAGTAVTIAATGDRDYVFLVDGDVAIAPGASATGAGEVVLIAETAGSEPNGAPGPVELVDALDYVASIALVSGPSGGVDAEPDEDYLARLVGELRLLAPRPILADDFAVLAHRVPGVERAVALDGYDPGTGTSNNERTVTVAVTDAAGDPLAAPVRAEVDALLQAEREVNFVVNVIDPTYTTLDVTFTVRALPFYDAAEVEASAESAVADYLSPATWGTPTERGALGDTVTAGLTWRNAPVVRYLELAEAINGAAGVDYIEALTFGLAGGALGTADVTMTGPAPLPRAGTITGTANAAA